MTIKSGRIKGFEEYSQFTTLQELNHHLEQWLLEHKLKLSKGELIGLKRLARFSAKVPGICNAKIGTILKAIHEEYNDNGISRSTFKRMILKARDLGILTIYETERKNGSQSSNLYIFNRFPSNEPPKEKKMNHHKETINPSKTNNQIITKRSEEPFELDHSYVSDRVPQPFTELIKVFFKEAKTIEEYWHMTTIAAYRNNREKETDTVLTTAIHSFKQMIRKLKSGQTVINPVAYYYGILNKKFEQLFIEELNEMGFFSSEVNEWFSSFLT